MTSGTDEAFVAVMGNTRERNHEENDSITDVEVVVKEIESGYDWMWSVILIQR